MARLILATTEGQQAIELRPINSLGRHPNNSIQLLDKIVSKEHCILEQRDGGFVLRDLGSLNGTYINGERGRGEQMLRHGDEIALGSTRARYDDGSGIPIDFNSPMGPGAIQHPQPGTGPMGGANAPPMQHGPPQGPAWGQQKGPSVPPPSNLAMPSGPMGTMGMPSQLPRTSPAPYPAANPYGSAPGQIGQQQQQ